MKNKVVVLVLGLTAAACLSPFILDIALRIQEGFTLDKGYWFLGGAGSALIAATIFVAIFFTRQQS